MKTSTAPLRILIADDHDIVREGLRTLICSHPGWEVCGEAVNGRETVQRARELRPDIVVLDLSMPELNGLEATRQIRKALPRTEVLVLTMHESEQLAQEVFDAGACSFVVKTDARRLLISAVEALAQHQPFFTPRVAELVMQGRLKPDLQAARSRRPRNRLTPREREIVQLVVEGKSNKEIAALLDRSVKTVEAHRSSVMHKLGLNSVSELVRYAIRNKIVEA